MSLRLTPLLRTVRPIALGTSAPASAFTSRSTSVAPNLRLAQLNSQFQAPIRRTMATSIPKTMKGVIIEKNGGVEVLQYKTDLPVPEPGEGQILVKNDFMGINYIDT